MVRRLLANSGFESTETGYRHVSNPKFASCLETTPDPEKIIEICGSCLIIIRDWVDV
jgi:hypothetical protein